MIIDGDEELGEDDLREALRLVKDFRQGSQHRFVVSFDEGARETWDQDLEPTAVLVAQPMDFGRVCLYLKRLNTPAATQLHEVIEQRRCRDIAGTPWLLERMIALSQRKVSFDSRATLLRQIANECLTSIPMGGVPRFYAERVLDQVGWQMQWGRQSILGGADLYRILADVRGNREFRLGDLKDLLIRSGILASSGEDAVRFRYQSLQAYYAARYLAASPDRRRLLEDITASLGRLARARWWEKTLVTMAGLDGPSSQGISERHSGRFTAGRGRAGLPGGALLPRDPRRRRSSHGTRRSDRGRADLAIASRKSAAVRGSQAVGDRPCRTAPPQRHPSPDEPRLRPDGRRLGHRKAL